MLDTPLAYPAHHDLRGRYGAETILQAACAMEAAKLLADHPPYLLTELTKLTDLLAKLAELATDLSELLTELAKLTELGANLPKLLSELAKLTELAAELPELDAKLAELSAYLTKLTTERSE
jgi:monomeric isocitrate dehydrogenase